MSPRNRSIVITRRAQRDIDDIILHSLDNWDEDQARTYRAALERALDSLREFREIGQTREELGPDYRSLGVEQHVIYYRLEPTTILVRRILHRRREVRREMLE